METSKNLGIETMTQQLRLRPSGSKWYQEVRIGIMLTQYSLIKSKSK